MVGETAYSPTIFYTRTRRQRDEELLYEVITRIMVYRYFNEIIVACLLISGIIAFCGFFLPALLIIDITVIALFVISFYKDHHTGLKIWGNRSPLCDRLLCLLFFILLNSLYLFILPL